MRIETIRESGRGAWVAIFAHKLLTAKVYDLHDDDFKLELEKQWKRRFKPVK